MLLKLRLCSALWLLRHHVTRRVTAPTSYLMVLTKTFYSCPSLEFQSKSLHQGVGQSSCFVHSMLRRRSRSCIGRSKTTSFRRSLVELDLESVWYSHTFLQSDHQYSLSCGSHFSTCIKLPVSDCYFRGLR